ncbi:MAG: PAS domain S-box protein [Gammaproteobacteria bacterium]|nr:PAS domain S-box protein [Gammaproteobacteria bacterium]
MRKGRQIHSSDRNASVRLCRSAALILTIAGMLAAGSWAHHAWSHGEVQNWQLAAAVLMAVLSLMPIYVTARAQASRLHRSEARFGRFFERTTNPIIVLDPDTSRVIDANTHAGELFDCSRDVLLNKSLFELFAEEPRAINAFMQRVRTEGSAWNEQVRCLTSGGVVVQAEATATVSPDDRNLVLARLRNTDEHLRMERAVYSLAQLPSGLENEEFYRACVRDLANTYRCRWAFTGVFSDSSETGITTIAFWDGQAFRENFTYQLRCTPCAEVFAGCLRRVPEAAAQHYSSDPMLTEMGVESYMATPLLNLQGNPIGIVVIMDSEPMHAGRFSETLIEVYANRLAMELERRETLTKLRDSETNYRELVDGSLQGIIIHKDWQALYVNPQFLAMFGYQSLEEIHQLPSLQTLFDPGELPMLEGYLQARMRGEHAPDEYDVRATRKDGTAIIARNIVRLIHWNNEPAIQSTFVDITEGKTVQAALRESEENFRRLAEGSIEGIVIHRDFKPLYINPALARMLGFTTQKLFSLHDMLRLFPEHIRMQVREISDACLQGNNAPNVCTTEILHRDGRSLEVQMRTTFTQWNGERAVQATLIDITGQHEAEWILHSLHEFSAQQDLDFDARIQALLNAGCVYFDLPIGILSHIHDQTFEILNAVTPDDSLHNGDCFDAADTFCADIVENRKTSVYADVVEAGLSEHPCHKKFGLHSYAGVPLHVRGSTYGALGFASTTARNRPFKRSEVQILELMGRWVAGEIARQVDERDRVESQQRFRDFAETSADWFWETGPDMRFKLMQGKFKEVTGVDAGQILGISRDTVYERHVVNSAETKTRYATAVAARKPFTDIHVVWKRKDGELRILSNSGKPVFGVKGEFLGYRGAGRDVTEQTLAQEALKDSEERFRDFASTAADWFWETDGELRFTYVSENHARIIGRKNIEFLGKSRIEAYGNSVAKNMPGWQQHAVDMRARRPYAMNIELTRADGSPLIIYDQGKPLFDAKGTFLGYRGIGRDITDRVLTERELKKHQHSLEELVAERTQKLEATQKELLQQERLATIGRLVATVSHELRNPLGAVRNAAFYLKRKAPPGVPRWSEQLEIIDKEINSADKIISDLLETTRAKVPVMKDLDLERLVKQVFESCRGDHGVEFQYFSDPDDLWLAADRDHLRQVLLNLVTNSVHAMSDGGTVVVSARQEATRNVVCVRDDGPGIPDEHHEQIFEPLFTTKSKGNGLGLWISKEIIERHGGSLQLSSDTRSGTSFEISLPLDPHAGIMAATG